MSVEKFWMVVDVSEAQQHRRFGEFYQINPKFKAPTFMHETLESAETECLRLAREYPNGEFVVLEAMSYARQVSNQWATLTKKDPVRSVRLEDCVDISEIPF